MLSPEDADVAFARREHVAPGQSSSGSQGSSEAREAASPSALPVGGSGKRILDIGLALSAILALAPLFLCVALLILLRDGRPVLIRHQRVGFGGKLFDCLKFRSMVANASETLERHLKDNPEAAREWEETRKLRDDPRVTPVGQVIRRLSVDELPQLLNVVRGDMSIVGPRPVVVAELERYGPAVNEYMQVRPGLTGPWQVSGRSDVSYEARVALDAEYVRNWTMARDLAIIARTVPAVVAAKGSY
jgi:exopolysaccharide production protein ExoY